MLKTNKSPLTTISGLRPIQSASSPANKVEITLPSRTAATIIENCPAFRWDVASRYGSAPPIMPTSTPYNRPPRPATRRRNRLYVVFESPRAGGRLCAASELVIERLYDGR